MEKQGASGSLLLLGLVALCIAAGTCMFASTSSASAEITLCTPGSGIGQCQNPRGVAADSETGHLYVADQGNAQVDVFKDDGSPLFSFPAAPTAIAVDNTGGPNQGDVYVFEPTSSRIRRYDSTGAVVNDITANGACQVVSSAEPNVAIGPGGIVYVGVTVGSSIPFESSVSRFEPGGTCAGTTILSPAPTTRVKAIAVDSTGAFYIPFNGEGGFHKYSAVGAELFSKDLGVETHALATTGSDHLFAAQRENHGPVSFQVITEYEASGNYLRRFAYDKLDFALRGIATHASSSGDLLASEENVGSPVEGNRVIYLDFPPPGPIVPPSSVKVSEISTTKALIKAEINTEGKETQFHVEFLSEQEWKDQGESFAGPATQSTPPQTLSATDFTLHNVEALIGCTDPVNDPPSSCLTPETVYRYRVVASNPDGPGEGTAEGEPFETRTSPAINATFTTEVGTDSARLNAEVEPLGIPTTGYFEYVEDASFQESGFANAAKVPNFDAGASELDFGVAEAAVLRSATLAPLPPGTTFHYRISLTNPIISPGRVTGPERIFRTFATPTSESCPSNESFRTGPSALLGDCRAYEMVSPLDKASGDVITLGEFSTALPAVLNQSSVSGSKLAYGSYRAFGDAISAPYTSQYVAERGGESWQSHTITGPRGHLNGTLLGTLDTELRALSPDLCDAFLWTVAEPPLAPGALSGYLNLYRRHDNGGCGTQAYEALTTVPPLHVEPGGKFVPELQGVSADGTISIYTVSDNLEGTAAPDNPSEKEQLYEHSPGGTSYVCILPNEAPSTSACSAGTSFGHSGQNRDSNVDNAISDDGQRIFWTAFSPGPAGGPGQIYVRIGGAETIAVSKAGEIASGTGSSIFLKANSGGSKALYLTGEDLYEFEVDTEATTLIAHEVPGILGAAEDLSRIYLVSKEALAGVNTEGKSPEVGKPNLYLDEEGDFTFVATLRSEDVEKAPLSPLKGRTSAISLRPVTRNSRTSADGLFAAFMSSGNPTGYDNTDAKSQEADAEVYRYDAAAEELACVSCNPTNARPAGSDIGIRIPGGNNFWAGGSIGGWENTLYAPRNLSADGNRVFFESADVLSPGDSNGVIDVYEWEQAGSGGCSEASSSYSPLNRGCLSLISSGQSARLAEFNDASPSGEDVFFSTLASLVSQDYGLVDVYDARAGGGLPTPPAPPVECEGESCQSPNPAPEAQSPSSLGYEGPGDVNEAAKPKKCPKGKVKKNGRCVKKKHKKHHKSHHKQGRAAR